MQLLIMFLYNSVIEYAHKNQIGLIIFVSSVAVGGFVISTIVFYLNSKKYNKLSKELEINKEQLQSILDSTAEGIYGIDINGKCTFCNSSAIKLLGFSSQSEVLGELMHEITHHSYKDGSKRLLEDCKINKSIIKGQGIYVNDEVFWRQDGTCFDVKYNCFPQYENGQVIGAVITFEDITERKKKEEYIKFLSYHDTLTGLYNRKFFEDELYRENLEENLPLSIIYGDVNGLKLTNDVYGHDAGNELLKGIANILTKICREEDIIARMGGDEFAVLLKNTEITEVKEIVKKIDDAIKKENFAIKVNLSLGYDTKTSSDQEIQKVMNNAEGIMYKEKILNRRKVSEDMVSGIINTLHEKSDFERIHSENVANLCYQMGVAIGKDETERRKLKEAGYLHDVGKIAVSDRILNKIGEYTKDEKQEMSQHCIVGYRILNLFDHTIELAEAILNHHEYWDGTGYPKGIKGNEIPEMSRIISVAEVYHTITYRFNDRKEGHEYAINEIKKMSGKKFDPYIVNVFLNMINNYKD